MQKLLLTIIGICLISSVSYGELIENGGAGSPVTPQGVEGGETSGTTAGEESDPIWTAARGNYLQVGAETDPIWTGVSNQYATTNYVDTEIGNIDTTPPVTNTTTEVFTNSVAFVGMATLETDGANGTDVVNYQTMTGHIATGIAYDVVPDADDMYNLGSPSNKWASLYVSTNTIYLGEYALSVGDAGTLQVVDSADTNAPLPVQYATVPVVTNLVQTAFTTFMNDGSRFHSEWSGGTNSLYIVSPDGVYTNLLMTTTP